MRTTLEIADDVLLAAKSIAAQRGVSAGQVASELMRAGLQRAPAGATRNGVPIFAARPGASVVTLDLVNRLRDETP